MSHTYRPLFNILEFEKMVSAALGTDHMDQPMLELDPRFTPSRWSLDVDEALTQKEKEKAASFRGPTFACTKQMLMGTFRRVSGVLEKVVHYRNGSQCHGPELAVLLPCYLARPPTPPSPSSSSLSSSSTLLPESPSVAPLRYKDEDIFYASQMKHPYVTYPPSAKMDDEDDDSFFLGQSSDDGVWWKYSSSKRLTTVVEANENEEYDDHDADGLRELERIATLFPLPPCTPQEESFLTLGDDLMLQDEKLGATALDVGLSHLRSSFDL